jgi:hypothetical protein
VAVEVLVLLALTLMLQELTEAVQVVMELLQLLLEAQLSTLAVAVELAGILIMPLAVQVAVEQVRDL